MRLKQAREEEALSKISNNLPDSERFLRIVQEYEQRATREAEFAKAIDCIDSCVRNLNDTRASNEDGFTEKLIRNKYQPHVSKFPFILELFEVLMSKLVAQNKV